MSSSQKPDRPALLRACDSALKQGLAEVCQTDAARYGVAVVGEARMRFTGDPQAGRSEAEEPP